MDPASTVLKLFAVLVLVGINAYFVAAEFALVATRRTRIEQLARSGDTRAGRVLSALDEPDSFISTAQLGITVASIAIGYIAEGTLHALLLPYVVQLQPAIAAVPFLGDPGVASHIIGTIITLFIVTFLHVVIGEQVPKMVAIQRAEAIALWTVAPTQLFARILKPFIRLMSGSANAVMRLFGMKPTSMHALAHSVDELRLLVEQSHEEGIVESDQEQMIAGVFEFRETLAREVMTPRPDIVALPINASRDDVLRLASDEGHSRIPVYEDTLDEIIGILLVKDLLATVVRKGDFDLPSLLREPIFVPDTKRIDALLAELRTKSVHMAIVLDEFGGTMGLVTLEDILEEIVGDIYDEHDLPETEFEITPAGEVLIDGGASISEVNERFGLELPEADFDTVGGYIFGELGRVPVAGDEVPLGDGTCLQVDDVEDRRITRVRLLRSAPEDAPMSDSDTLSISRNPEP
ncbi:MAG TPA: hemolysin family protein [Longimicrobiales bacterium]